MANIYISITELVGRTPILEVSNIEKELNLEARILVKLEYFNPAGSVKDRVALNMIETRRRKADQTGSHDYRTDQRKYRDRAGIGGGSKGYKAVFVMPETMSIERRKLLLGYGAEIVLTEGAKGMNGALQRRRNLKRNGKMQLYLVSL